MQNYHHPSQHNHQQRQQNRQDIPASASGGGFRQMAAAMSWSQLTKMLDAARVRENNGQGRTEDAEDDAYGHGQQPQTHVQSAYPHLYATPSATSSSRAGARSEVEYLLQRHFRANEGTGGSLASSESVVAAGGAVDDAGSPPPPQLAPDDPSLGDSFASSSAASVGGGRGGRRRGSNEVRAVCYCPPFFCVKMGHSQARVTGGRARPLRNLTRGRITRWPSCLPRASTYSRNSRAAGQAKVLPSNNRAKLDMAKGGGLVLDFSSRTVSCISYYVQIDKMGKFLYYSHITYTHEQALWRWLAVG